jgi:hypothetical protein
LNPCPRANALKEIVMLLYLADVDHRPGWSGVVINYLG